MRLACEGERQDVRSQDLDGTRGRLLQTSNAEQKRRLAGPGGADDGGQPAFGNVQVDIVQDARRLASTARNGEVHMKAAQTDARRGSSS